MPVSFLHPIDDEECFIEDAEKAYAEITAPDSYFRIQRGDHLAPFSGETDEFVNRMLETIQTGTVKG